MINGFKTVIFLKDLLESVSMRPQMKFARNQILFRHAKNYVYITFYCGRKLNFISGLFRVKRPTEKCKQNRARYKESIWRQQTLHAFVKF